MAKFLCHEQPKVCYDNFASFQEYVFSLEVSVNNALGMQIAHTLKSYSYNGAWQVVKDWLQENLSVIFMYMFIRSNSLHPPKIFAVFFIRQLVET